MLKIESDGTVEGTKVTFNGETLNNVKRVVFDIDPGAKHFPSMSISLAKDENGDWIRDENDKTAIVDCHGKKFKLEVG